VREVLTFVPKKTLLIARNYLVGKKKEDFQQIECATIEEMLREREKLLLSTGAGVPQHHHPASGLKKVEAHITPL
jgi:hypothetical protein